MIKETMRAAKIFFFWAGVKNKSQILFAFISLPHKKVIQRLRNTKLLLEFK